MTKEEAIEEVLQMDGELIGLARGTQSEKTASRIAKREAKRSEIINQFGLKGKYWNRLQSMNISYNSSPLEQIER